MTSVSWVIPALDQQAEEGSLQQQPGTPSINTCRPMSYQEDGAKVMMTRRERERERERERGIDRGREGGREGDGRGKRERATEGDFVCVLCVVSKIILGFLLKCGRVVASNTKILMGECIVNINYFLFYNFSLLTKKDHGFRSLSLPPPPTPSHPLFFVSVISPSPFPPSFVCLFVCFFLSFLSASFFLFISLFYSFLFIPFPIFLVFSFLHVLFFLLSCKYFFTSTKLCHTHVGVAKMATLLARTLHTQQHNRLQMSFWLVNGF